MSPSRALVSIVLAVPLLLGACDDSRRAISRDDLPEVPAEPTEVVELGDDGFDEGELQVTTSDLVEFRNVGREEHGIRTVDSTIDTGLLLPGESAHVVFDEPDRYELKDIADDSATMTIIATAGD